MFSTLLTPVSLVLPQMLLKSIPIYDFLCSVTTKNVMRRLSCQSVEFEVTHISIPRLWSLIFSSRINSYPSKVYICISHVYTLSIRSFWDLGPWLLAPAPPPVDFRSFERHPITTKYMLEDKVHAHFVVAGKQRQGQNMEWILIILSVELSQWPNLPLQSAQLWEVVKVRIQSL